MRRRLPAAAAAAALALAALASPPARAADQSGPPAISAPAAILVQPDTGDVVFKRAAGQSRLIASTTKLMTALVTRQKADLDEVFRAIDYHASPLESLVGLVPGERMSVRDLLRGLLLASGNDAAATLAVRVSGSTRAFVRRMNAEARKLGLRDTHYSNPIGLDSPRNHSSAEDLAKLALIVLEDPFLRRTVDLGQVTLHGSTGPEHIVNRNTLVREVPWMSGVKTGHTNAAGYVLVGAARRHGVRLVSAVIGDPSEAARDADTLALMRYGLSRYHRITMLRGARVLARAKLDYRDRKVDLVPAHAVHLVTRRGERPRVRVVGAPTEVSGPLDRGAHVGTVQVRRDGRVVASVPLVTAKAVPEASLGDKVTSAVPVWAIVLGASVLAAGSLRVGVQRRRARTRRRAKTRRRGTEPA